MDARIPNFSIRRGNLGRANWDAAMAGSTSDETELAALREARELIEQAIGSVLATGDAVGARRFLSHLDGMAHLLGERAD